MGYLNNSVTDDEFWNWARAEWRSEAERVLQSILNGSASTIIATGPSGIGKSCLLTPNIVAVCADHRSKATELFDGAFIRQCRSTENITNLVDASTSYGRYDSAKPSIIILDEAFALIEYPIKKNLWRAKHLMCVLRERRLTPILISPSKRQWFCNEASGVWREIASDCGYNTCRVIELEKRTISTELATRTLSAFGVDDDLIAFIGDYEHEALRTPLLFSFLLTELHCERLQSVKDLKALLQARRGLSTFWEDMIDNSWGLSLSHMLRVVQDLGIPTRHARKYRPYD